MTVSSANETHLENQSIIPMTLGNILYVGGSGPGNYSKIQDAIENSSDGDTVFVYDDSSPYYENVLVNKSITLKGENKKTTIIDGKKVDFVIHVRADSVTITGFMIIHSRFHINYAGIMVSFSDNSHIYDNIIENNHNGIRVTYSYHCNITSNILDDNYFYGIVIDKSPYTYISKNKVTNTSWFGIDIHYTSDTVICELNHIEKTGYTGIFLSRSQSNIIRNNNFIKNKHHAFYMNCSNNWSGNYWNRPRILPMIIFGRKDPFARFKNMIDFDWHPVQEPYDILPLEV
jgi:parallel beta-helix repeat protein